MSHAGVCVRTAALALAGLLPGPTPSGPAPAAAAVAPMEALRALRSVRQSGCEGRAGLRLPLRWNPMLAAAAAHWSRGAPLSVSIARSGYRDDKSAGVHLSGVDRRELARALGRQLCSALSDPRVSDAGVFGRQGDLWIVLAAPFTTPSPVATATIAGEILRQVNAARAAGSRCGRRRFPAAPPLSLSSTLSAVAQAQALDMVRFDYFEHVGHDGSTPRQRIAAAGGHYHLVGENLAFGPESAAEAVRGWLASPGHCQNIMEARFDELGVGYAASHSGPPRIYWVQEFGATR